MLETDESWKHHVEWKKPVMKDHTLGFPGGPVVKTPPAKAEDMAHSLVQEDPICHEATSPFATIPEPVLQSLGAATTEPACLPAPEAELCNEKPMLSATRGETEQPRRSNTATYKQTHIFFFKRSHFMKFHNIKSPSANTQTKKQN